MKSIYFTRAGIIQPNGNALGLRMPPFMLAQVNISTQMTLIELMNTDKAQIALSFRHVVRNPSDYSADIEQIFHYVQYDR